MIIITRHFTALFFILFFANGVPSFAQEAAGEPTLFIQGGTLIDGTGADPVVDATIVVRGNKILRVSRGTARPAPQGARVVDARGKYVLPGLIDGHAHYSGWAAQLYLHYGITTVVDVGNASPWIFAQQWAIENGLIPGPRIYAAGNIIDNPPPSLYISDWHLVETPEQARAAVRHEVAAGADAIKVYKQLRPNLMRVVVEEAHFHGIPVTAHLASSARDAVMMGVDSLEHASGVAIATTTDREKLNEVEQKRYTDRGYLAEHSTVRGIFYYMEPELVPDLVRLFVEKGTSVTPNLAGYWIGTHRFADEYKREDEALLADPAYAAVPELARRWIPLAHDFFGRTKTTPRYQQAYRNMQMFLKQFADAGGKAVVGTDSTSYEMHAVNLHREMELWVDAGVTPMQTLLGATKHAAEKYRKWNEVGSVEPGKYADFVILDANPLEDIRNTRKIHMVIQNGRILDTTLDPNFVDQIPQPSWSEEIITNLGKLLFEDED